MKSTHGSPVGFVKPMALAVALLSASSVMAATTTPYSQSFESYGTNTPVTDIDTPAWTAGSNTYGVVFLTNDLSGIFSECFFPLNSATHTNVVKLDTENGSLTNNIEHGRTNIVWIDTMVQFTPWTDDKPPATNDAAVTNLLMVYLSTNNGGALTLFCSSWTDSATLSNTFAQLSHVAIATDDWSRITIQMGPYNAGGRWFKVQLNGQELSSDMGYTTNSSRTNTHLRPGPWHLQGNQNATNISCVVFSGTGYFDDFVFTNGMPTFSSGVQQWLIAMLKIPTWGGNISPSSPFMVDEGSTNTLTFTPSNYWDVGYFEDNGFSNASAGAYAISNIIISHTVVVHFAAITATNPGAAPTPQWWLNQYAGSADPTNAIGDSDSDGMFNWQEWLAGTDPADSNSVLEINPIYVEGGVCKIKWVSRNFDRFTNNLPPFIVQVRSNLLVDVWTNAEGAIVSRPTNAVTEFTNTWSESGPVSAIPYFHRVVVPTNTP